MNQPESQSYAFLPYTNRTPQDKPRSEVFAVQQPPITALMRPLQTEHIAAGYERSMTRPE
jgi:hypothetical protein